MAKYAIRILMAMRKVNGTDTLGSMAAGLATNYRGGEVPSHTSEGPNEQK